MRLAAAPIPMKTRIKLLDAVEQIHAPVGMDETLKSKHQLLQNGFCPILVGMDETLKAWGKRG